MSLINNFAISLFPIANIIFGFLLAAIAVEELNEHANYLRDVKILLGFLFVAFSSYVIIDLLFTKAYFYSLLIVISIIAYVLILFFVKKHFTELISIIPIPIVLLILGFISRTNDQLILASIATLYFLLLGVLNHKSIIFDKI